jgi:predicted CxxxxCH...CXXCH cytochrome family protein
MKSVRITESLSALFGYPMNKKSITLIVLIVLSLLSCTVKRDGGKGETVASFQDCTRCHQIPPQDSSHLLHAGMEEMPLVRYGNTGFANLYAATSEAYGFNCGNCHPQDEESHENGAVEISLSPIDAGGLKALNRPGAFYSLDKKTCQWVYCHSTGEKAPYRKFSETPPWGSTLGVERCQSCHGSPPAYRNFKGRVNGHFNPGRGTGHLLGIHWDSTRGHPPPEKETSEISYTMGCSTCHWDTVRHDRDTTFTDTVSGLFTCTRCHEKKGGEIYNYAKHVNGDIEVVFSPVRFRSKAQLFSPPPDWTRIGKAKEGGFDETVQKLNSSVYQEETKTCLNVACHIIGKEVNWGDAIGCEHCHGER